MTRRKDVRIEQVEGGFIVNLDREWVERVAGDPESINTPSKFITPDLNSALTLAQNFFVKED